MTGQDGAARADERHAEGAAGRSAPRAAGLLPAARFGADGAPVTFYVVRHGQTLFNVMGKVQGWCDTPLTDEGVRAAEALGRGLAGVDFTAAFSSDSGRAVQTLDALLGARAAQRGESYAPPETFPPTCVPNGPSSAIEYGALHPLLCAETPFPLAHDPRLREWCYGDLEGEPGEQLRAALAGGFGAELSFEEHNRRLPEVADVLARADTSGRAERFDAIERRLSGFFAEAGEAVRLAGGGNALVVTHSFVVRTLVYLLDPARVNDPAKIPNASVTRIGYDGHAFSLAEIGSTDWQR